MQYEEISCRQFATKLGVSNQWVSDRLKDCTINHGVVGKDTPRPRIIPDIAMAELRDFVRDVSTSKLDMPEETKLLLDKAFEKHGSSVKKKQSPDTGFIMPSADGFSEEEGDEWDEPTREDFSELPDHTPKAESQRRITLYQARKAKLEYEEMKGNLVQKGAVYDKLYNFAQAMRDRIMNVPDRCIDDVLAAPGRNQALKRMGDEIAAALIELSDTGNIKI